MLTPYDWQESIGHRAQYIESRLEQGRPVLAVSIEAGILFVTYHRQSPKVYEIYDKLAFAALGQQSDIEALRLGAVDFAHQEGYNRSEADVTIQRVVAGLSAPLKRAFGDFGTAPVVARALFAEVAPSAEGDRYFILDYDGDYVERRNFALLSAVDAPDAVAAMSEVESKASPEQAQAKLQEIWESLQPNDGEGLTIEVALLERSDARVNRFRRLVPLS